MAVLSASLTWYGVSPGAASSAGAPVAVGLAVMLLFIVGRRGGNRGQRALQAIPVIGWFTIPAWLGPVVEAAGPTIAAFIPYALFRDLSTNDAVFFVESIINTIVVTAAMGTAYLAATGSWKVATASALSGLAVLVVCATLSRFPIAGSLRDLAVLGSALAASTAPIFWWLLAAPNTPAASRCRACGYDLSGIASPTCPECGDPRRVEP